MSLQVFSENTWHTFLMMDFLDPDRTRELKRVSHFASTVKASGDELLLIRQRVENVPITKGNRCEWKQPFAGFILNNLIETKETD